ncbi:lytic transglycosylase domain-containing protein [Immundisolibacter sp.]|uniref:lytic transglycosylase domain-containing protein n=1 Tax=Immundisolibacter sp. TaxID=1934948 RepID=UPI00262C61B5|nr:lytic transglycosylase domain-containing protein [Immundisolibacter sp.]MDD3651282.1 transglycosylase SLT domain-containing protein [Immundisolibacter sp.]
MLCCIGAVRADPAALPRPPALEPAVRFWARVFTEVDTHSGFLHDDRRLGVVYETIGWSGDLDRAARQALVEPGRLAIQNALLARADGTADATDPLVRRVRALGQGASPAELRAAAVRVRFQLGQADRFAAALRRAGTWEPHIRSTLRQYGVPQEIGALPYVESGFDPMAGSHVGAAGLWQFMASTGRLFLRIDQFVDERYDPHAATVAAAKLLRGNYDALGTWPLALTAYNHGRAGMRRAVDALGSDDIAVLIERYDGPAFGFASRNFYPTFLAALELSSKPEAHFGPIAKAPPARMQEVTLPAYLPLAVVERELGVERAELRALNPALRRSVWDDVQLLPKGYDLRLPDDMPGADARIAELARRAGRPTPLTVRRYQVRRGETLGGIAARHGLSTRQLAAHNGLSPTAKVRIDQVLKLPVRDAR